MSLAVVWGMSGVLGVLVILFYGLLFFGGGIAYAGEAPYPRPHAWLHDSRALGCFAMSIACVAFAVAGFWGATHVRSVELTVQHLRTDLGGDGSQYYVDAASGESYDTSEDVFDHLREGARARCETTTPLLFLEGTLTSCTRLHTRHAADTALRAARTAAGVARASMAASAAPG